MSKQKFSSEEREAIWLAYNKKCAYTAVTLEINKFHIDHIIPEHLSDKPEEFSALRERLSLPDDFDICGYENVLPCQVETNLQKGKIEFEEGHAHYFLNFAKSKKNIIEKNIIKIKNRNDKNKGLFILRQYIESGKVSMDDIQRVLRSDGVDEIYKLIISFKLSSEEEIEEIKKSDVDDLWDRRVCIGINYHIDGLELCNDLGEKIIVRTGREYVNAISNNYYAYTTLAMKMATYFEQQCGLLSAISNAITPSISYIENPKVGIHDLDLLPFHMFPDLSRGCNDNFDMSLTYQDKVDDKTLTITHVKQNELRFESKSMGHQLVEVARADFSSEGYDSILCFEYTWATGGSFGHGGIKILTRKSPDALFELIDTKLF